MEYRDGASRWKSIHTPENISLFHYPLNVNQSTPCLQSDPILNSHCTAKTMAVK